jgi:hypothetical protein
VGILLLLLLAGFGGPFTIAQPSVRLETRVSADSVAVGERFTVALAATHEKDTDVVFPTADAGPVVFGDVDVLDRSGVRTHRLPGGQVADSVVYTATTFALDSVRVPTVPVQVVAEGDTTIATAPARTLTVVSVVPSDAKGIHGVAPLAPFPRPLWTWLLLGLVALGLLAGLAYLWWRRRQPSDPAPAKRPLQQDKTPYEAATTWIRQLESYDLSDPDAVKPFYVELSNALRVYLARELEVATLERTTREVAEVLEARPDVPPEAAARIRAVLELADLVKFADAQPTASDHEKALEEARTALDTLEAARPQNSPAGGNGRPPTPEAVDGVASATQK